MEAKTYTVGQVAKLLAISPSTIKAWEKSQYISKARRVKLNRVRIFTESQVEEIAQFMREGMRR